MAIHPSTTEGKGTAPTVLCPSRFMNPSASKETAVKTTQGIMNVPPTVWTEAPVGGGVYAMD